VTATASANGLTADHGPAAIRRGWIESPRFDLPMFVFAPLAGLGFLALALSVPAEYAFMVQAAAFYFVAVPHYMSTYTFFLGDDNLRYYRSRRLAFFGGPGFITLAVVVLWLLRFPPVIQAAVFVWNIWHVARQNSGILAMYRRLNAGARAEHLPANLAILGISAGMAFWHIERYPPIGRALTALHAEAGQALALAFLGLGAVALVVYFRRLAARDRAASPHELGFLVSSLAMFHPYLWVRDYTLATLGMLMGHFVQYLAIVWLLHHRKYRSLHTGSPAQRLLARVSAQYGLIGAFIAVSGLFFIAANHTTAAIGVPSVYTVSWFAFTFIHFYLDGFIWAFRQPFVRESVGSYLMPANRVVA
jgi:hypothetical protein